METLIVTRPFVGHGFNMPKPGTLIEVSEELAGHLIAIDVARVYETKITRVPQEVKKKPAQSESSQAGRARQRKTRRRSKKSVTKSSR